MVDGGGQLVHLPLDVVGDALRELLQVPLVLQDGGHHLKVVSVFEQQTPN